MKLQNLLVISAVFLGSTQVLCRSVTELMAAEGIEIVNGELNLRNKGLTSLEGLNAIAGIENLQRLDFYNNPLSTLPAGVFDGLTSLETLYLSRNQLSTLLAGVFDGLTSLRQLNLSDNQLSTLPAGIFNGLTSLQVLDLSSNQLSTLPAGIFNGLTSLQVLDLSENRLNGIQVDRIEQFCRGSRINLSILNQKAPPITLEPNVTEEEYEEAVGIAAYRGAGHTQEEIGEFKKEKYDKEGCLICHGAIETYPNYITACGHRYHTGCLEEWLNQPNVNKTKCPFCSKNLFTGEIIAFLKNQQKNTHLAKHTRRKNKKSQIQIAQRAKKSKVAHA